MGRGQENWTTIFYCIYCQIFSMKTKFILDFLFILITLVGLNNTRFKLYKKCYKKFMHTKHKKTFASSFLRSLSNSGKWDSFLENALWKMTHFSKNVIAETNKA